MTEPTRTGPLQTIASIARDTHTNMKEAKILMVASSLSYTTILSIIPVLAVSFSIFKAFGGMEKLYELIEPYVIENLAQGADEAAMNAIKGFINNIHAGAIGATGFVGLIFTCMSLLYSAESAIHQLWKAPMTRRPFQRLSYYWVFITLGPLALAIAVGAGTSIAASKEIPITNYLPGGTGLFTISAIVFYLIFRYVPHRPVKWKAALIASLLTATAWNLARIIYTLYTKKVLTYSKIYGSLSAVPLLLLWIYIVWVIVLTGAALTAAIQKRWELQS